MYILVTRSTIAVTLVPLGNVQAPLGGGSSVMEVTLPPTEPKH